MSIRTTALMGFALAVTLGLAGSASAQTKHTRHARTARVVVLAESKAPPLTIQKRSFLDSGNVTSPQTDMPEYLAANTTDNVQIYQSFAPSRFGESTLGGRFDLPNNPRYTPNRDLDFGPF